MGVGFLVYGLGMAPAYYSWGFFAPEVINELGITRQNVGEIFGIFTLLFAVTSMLSAAAINRWGLRYTVSAGATLAAGLQVAAGAPDGSVMLVMLPDTGERYLSTPLFEGVNEGSDDDWLESLS